MNNIYKTALENMDLFVIVTDLNGNIIYSNNAFSVGLHLNNINKQKMYMYEHRIYSVKYKTIDNYKYEIYSDVTNYETELNKLKRDYLTNLYNRFAIIENLEKLKNQNYTLVMGDIDFFKKINDGYGHLVGDHVLKGISDLLVKYIGTKGIVGRYGGEEFIIVIPTLNVNESYELIEKIRNLIKETKIKVKYNNCIKEFYISMTFGITGSDPNKSINELIGEADSALYIGKKNGRNQTNIYKKDED